MGYNRLNLLEKIKQVNEIYIRFHSEGVTNEYIYKHYIRNQFFISKVTFYNYLTIPYNLQIKEEKEKINRQKQLKMDFNYDAEQHSTNVE